ncbi:MarR family winged helix-turn-helix transcriptional regulator, partial [Ruminococcus bromii]|uniref:MarR family winged helix-turn-helix transcriptional regulator n=1 Tax=Ruminococcus bromii TaxID=40518 RepID=UPI00241F3601
MAEGFVIFPRWMYSNGVLNGDRDYWSVWSYLMFNVNYFDTQVILKNEVLTVHKDEIFTTRRKISEAIGVSETKVDKALKLFEKVGYIKMKSDRRGRLISLTFEELRTKLHTTPSQENVNYCADTVQSTDNQECCNADGETPHNDAKFGGFETETKPKQNQNKTETKPKQNQNAYTKEINKEINKGNKRNKMNKDILSGKPDGTNESEIIR